MSFESNSIRAFNAAGHLWRQARPSALSLDSNSLLAAARKEAGLHDFGAVEFREGLDRLVDALEHEAGLTAAGRVSVKRTLTRLLVQRLRFRHEVKRSALVPYEVIRSPLVVTGLPGRSLELVRDLLALDPMQRPLRRWEADEVAPPANLDAERSDPRLVEALHRRGRSALADALADNGDPTLPADCSVLLAGSFRSHAFSAMGPVPTYSRWLDSCDMGDPYEHHRTQLALLQTTNPTHRWSLASADHLPNLSTVQAVYPDAQVVIVHRDPAPVIEDLTHRLVASRRRYCGPVDDGAVQEEVSKRLQRSTNRAASALDGMDHIMVFHLQFAEFVEDPVGAIERIYRFRGLELPDVGRLRMQAWIDQGGSGPDPTRRGAGSIDADEVRGRFGDYLARFAVPSEPVRR